MPLLKIQEPLQAKEHNEENEIVIGIDLGTTNSLVAIIENEKVRTLSDENGNDMIASIVCFDESGNLVGVGKDYADNKRSIYKISSIKRIMGKSLEEIQAQNFSYKNLISANKTNATDSEQNSAYKNLYDHSQNKEAIFLNIDKRKISAVEISAEILKYLKEIAEKNLDKTIQKAVITVPAYFDENAKNATKQSAKLAGLEVIRLLNEPTSAALAYGLDNKSQGTYCVYDLGGGTFDISILKIQNGVFKVLGVSGDNNLGGDDFDEILKNLGFKNPRKAKEILSTDDFFEEDNKRILRSEFESLILEKINKTIKLTQNLLDDLELADIDIEGVILVGGSTRIPLIHKELSKIFGPKKILTNLDPDRVVAIGAAWQAYNLSGAKKNLLLDVNPLSLGIEMMGGIVDKIILRNSTIPISKAKEFTTYADNQTAMKLHIVQGEREFARDCRSLAEFEIKNIPMMKAGLARIRIVFTLDVDGLLTVSAEEKITGQKQEIIVKPSYTLQENDIKEMLLDSLKNSKTDIQNRLLAELIVEAEHDLEIVEKDLNNSDLKISDIERNIIIQKIEILKNHLKQRISREEIKQAQEELAKSSETLILQKVNKVLNQKITGKKIDEIDFKSNS